MLTVKLPAKELFDEETNCFFTTQAVMLDLEHSLVSLSKWEQKWEKPFIGNKDISTAESLDYIRCMCLSTDIAPEVFVSLSDDTVSQVTDYINAKMTATWFNEGPGSQRTQETITNEIIYYWLVEMQIPFETQFWHLNQLLTLIRVINIKRDPNKKMMPANEQLSQQRDLNARNREKFNSKG